jgi:D-alanyl-D-alanine carboxypeptidase
MRTSRWTSQFVPRSDYTSPTVIQGSIMRRFLLSFLLLSFAASLSFGAEVAIPSAPTVDARSYILVDYRTGKTLAALEPTARMEPASLTKLMTSYIVFRSWPAAS